MKMTITQFREWVATTEFFAEQGVELGGETHKAIDHTDEGEPNLVEYGYGLAWRTLTAMLPNWESFQATAETGIEFPGNERARIKDEWQTYPAQQGTTWQGLTITNDDGEDLDDFDQAAEINEALEGKGLTAFEFEATLPPVITTDIDITEGSEMELITVERDNGADIRFVGEEVASTSSSVNNSSSYYSGSTGRWTTLKLYKTKGGRFIAQQIGHTQWQGEHTRYSAAVCASEEEVVAFFGHGWLAKQLYDEAGIDAVEDIE